MPRARPLWACGGLPWKIIVSANRNESTGVQRPICFVMVDSPHLRGYIPPEACKFTILEANPLPSTGASRMRISSLVKQVKSRVGLPRDRSQGMRGERDGQRVHPHSRSGILDFEFDVQRVPRSLRGKGSRPRPSDPAVSGLWAGRKSVIRVGKRLLELQAKALLLPVTGGSPSNTLYSAPASSTLCCTVTKIKYPTR
jgi:hypothetical protein